MTSEELAEIANRWAQDPNVASTHYEGCRLDHWGCAIAGLVAEVERMEAALDVAVEALREVLEECDATSGANAGDFAEAVRGIVGIAQAALDKIGERE